MRLTKILTGDALAVLKTLPANSVQCCVTSPPYWGLRDYGIPPQVWGGDPNHSHEWGTEVDKHATNHVDKRRWNHARNGRGEEQPIEKRPGWKRQHVKQGSFCECGAWRGVLGLEPAIDMYVAHIVEVFREARRVLKDNGTLWLNLGDSYATGGGKACSPGGGKQGEQFQGPTGYRGAHDPSPKHRLAQVPDTKNPNAGIPTFQPNRMPQAGLKPKDLCMIPARVALALQADGWYLRSDIIWHKTNPMPESIKDRPTKSHEYLFLLSKSEHYFYDADAIKEPTTGSAHDRARKDRAADGQKTLPTAERNGMRAPGVNPKAQKWPNAWCAEAGRHDGIGNGRFRPSGNKERKIGSAAKGRLNTHMGSGVPWPPAIRPKQNESFSAAVTRTVERRNKRTVWTISTKPFKGAHFATFPPKLIEPCILAGSRKGDIVLDPFNGAGTTGLVAGEHGRGYLGIELNPAYVAMARKRLLEAVPPAEKSLKASAA